MAQLTADDDYLNVLYVGPPNSGKTPDMASMANLGPVVYVDFEAGLKKRALKNLGINVDNIDRRVPKSYDELEALYWDLESNLASDPHRWVGVAIDSVTDQQGKFVFDVVATRVAKEQAKASQNVERLNPHHVQLDDYGIWTNQAMKLARKFRDLPCHTAFGALEKREQDSSGVHLLPALTDSFRLNLMGYMDVIAHKVVAENPHQQVGLDYLGIMRPVSLYCGKDRLSMTPKVMATPSMERLIKLLRDELDLATDPAQIAYEKRMAERA